MRNQFPQTAIFVSFFLGISLASLSVQGEVSVPDSRVWLRAKNLNLGQQVWSIQTDYSNETSRFSSSGGHSSMATKRSVTWGQLLRTERSLGERAHLESLMKKAGQNENGEVASTTYSVERKKVGMTAEWAYGLTGWLTIGAQAPLRYKASTLKQQVTWNSRAQAVLGSDRARWERSVREAASEQLDQDGYDEVPSQSETLEWGDIDLLAQVALYESSRMTWSLQNLVRFPTAANADTASLLEEQSDEGQTDLGVTSMTDYRYRRWTVGGRVGYMAQLPDKTKLRVADGVVDSDVKRDLGDWVWAALDVDWKLNGRVSFAAGYAFLNKAADRYAGKVTKASDYVALGEGSDQVLHQSRVGLNYGIAQYGSRRGVENKWIASLGYTQPFSGKNSSDSGRAALEITTYF